MDRRIIERSFYQAMKKPFLKEGFLSVSGKEEDENHQVGEGRGEDTPMLLASITKLFTTTVIFCLMEEGKLTLGDALGKYLSEETLEGLHRERGKDHSPSLTIGHLLTQTSGLPDYYLHGSPSLFDQVKERDFAYGFGDILLWVKKMPAEFQPGGKRKAYYANVNFDLLGEVIEKVSGESLSWAYAHYILQPLGLSQTYLLEKAEDQVPETYLQGKRIHRPQFIRSTKASGGMVSTAKELRIFLQVFFQGTLFPKKHLLGKRRSLQMSFYPILYSQGFMCVPVKKPFEEEDFDAAIEALREHIASFDPTLHGFYYEEDTAPSFQLEPQGQRGYIEARLVSALKD